jgi:WD40 repeat protein
MKGFLRLISRSFWSPLRAAIALALGLASALLVVFAVHWFDDGIEHVATIRPRGFVSAIAWSPDGKTLASISNWGAYLTLWDVETRRRTELGGVVGPYIFPSLYFVADGRHLLAPPRANGRDVSVQHAFTLWDVATGQVVKDIVGPVPNGMSRLNNPYRYDVSRDGKLAALVPIEDERIHIYETKNWTVVKSEYTRSTDPIFRSFNTFWTFALTQDARKAVLARTSVVSILNLESGKFDDHRIYDDESVRSTLGALAVSPDGRYVAIAGAQGKRDRVGNPVAELATSDLLQIRSLEDWSLTANVDQGGRLGSGHQVTWSADGAYIAVAVGTTAAVYSMRSRVPLSATERIIRADTYVGALAFSPARNLLAIGDAGLVTIYKVNPERY